VVFASFDTAAGNFLVLTGFDEEDEHFAVVSAGDDGTDGGARGVSYVRDAGADDFERFPGHGRWEGCHREGW